MTKFRVEYPEMTDVMPSEIVVDGGDTEDMVCDYAIDLWEECFPEPEEGEDDERPDQNLFTLFWTDYDGKEIDVDADTAAKIAEADEEHADVFKALLGDEDLDTALLVIDKGRYSYYCDGANYAEQYCEDVGYIPEELPWWIKNCIDWEEVWNHMSGDVTYVETASGGVVIYDTDF